MKTRQLFFGLFILFGLTLNYSCTEDGGLGGGIDNELDVPASMALDLINGSLLDGVTTDAGNSFQISVSVTPGTTPLDILRVEEDGVTLPADRILQDGAPISGNPKLLLGTDKDGINFTLDITTSAEEKMSTYTVIVEDESDLIVSQGFVVNTMLVDPMIAINGDPNLVVPPGSIVELNLTATPGSAPLSFITVGSEGGVFVDPTNLFYGEINAAFDDNPYRLPEEDKNGFNKSIFLRVHDAGAQSYNIVIIDENERGHLVEFTIEVGDPTTE